MTVPLSSTKKEPTAPKKSVLDKKNAQIKPFQCSACDSVFKAKPNVKTHFKRMHPNEQYDSSKIQNIKFKCYHCETVTVTYDHLEKHFLKFHTTQILNPKKVMLGSTKKTAATLLKIKFGKPPQHIVKNLPKKAPTKQKTVVKKKASPIKLKMGLTKYRCKLCGYADFDQEKMLKHKLAGCKLEHETNEKTQNSNEFIE